MSCYFEFLADNGHRYCIAGVSEGAIMDVTKQGKEPDENFRHLIGDAQRFLSFSEISEDYILENHPYASHYIYMSKGIFASDSSTKVFWIY